MSYFLNTNIELETNCFQFYELETNCFQFYAIANLDKTSLLC